MLTFPACSTSQSLRQKAARPRDDGSAGPFDAMLRQVPRPHTEIHDSARELDSSSRRKDARAQAHDIQPTQRTPTQRTHGALRSNSLVTAVQLAADSSCWSSRSPNALTKFRTFSPLRRRGFVTFKLCSSTVYGYYVSINSSRRERAGMVTRSPPPCTRSIGRP